MRPERELWVLKKDPAVREIPLDVPAREEGEVFVGIRCPLCEWRPDASCLWCCASGDGPEPPFDACGTCWNTFTTRGRCPGCAHQWVWTSCMNCEKWSLHEDWYENVSK